MPEGSTSDVAQAAAITAQRVLSCAADVLSYRHESIAAYQELNDQLSIQYINYDMADERQHVAYGKKWIPKLMATYGIDKPVEQFIDETVALWEAEYRSGTLPIHAQNN